MVLNEGSTISVFVDRDIAPSELNIVLLKRAGRIVSYSRTDEDGCAEFVHRSPGVYEIDVLGVDAPPRRVEVGEEAKTHEVVIKTGREQ